MNMKEQERLRMSVCVIAGIVCQSYKSYRMANYRIKNVWVVPGLKPAKRGEPTVIFEVTLFYRFTLIPKRQNFNGVYFSLYWRFTIMFSRLSELILHFYLLSFNNRF